MTKQDYKTQLENKYLNTEELLILKSIKEEQEKYFKPYLDLEDF